MKLTLVFAALLAVAIAAPSIAAPGTEELGKRSDGSEGFSPEFGMKLDVQIWA
ncbi:hypothetical protein VE04_01271 [Pseudogymnoascus sp. 24MN13]|nr:hypothetical protein VE04_01271 [Pseudogymnoascus sp. 24MN13]